jgi:hypothetical protein
MRLAADDSTYLSQQCHRLVNQLLVEMPKRLRLYWLDRLHPLRQNNSPIALGGLVAQKRTLLDSPLVEADEVLAGWERVELGSVGLAWAEWEQAEWAWAEPEELESVPAELGPVQAAARFAFLRFELDCWLVQIPTLKLTPSAKSFPA